MEKQGRSLPKLRLIARILLVVTINLFLVAGFTVSDNAAADIGAFERNTLIRFYKETNGDQWTNNHGWKREPLHPDGFSMPGTECSWYGIACNVERTHIERINLDENNLNGILPGQLGTLKKLKSLHLEYNQLKAFIPAELGNLSDLQQLHLEYNQLGRSIPPELGNLSNIVRINLRANLLTGNIPSEFGKLSTLKVLDLSSNLLTGRIPSKLGGLSNLTRLYFHDNHLKGSLPSTLGKLSKLRVLNLRDNMLKGPIPAEYINLKNLFDDMSDFRWNQLSISNLRTRNFLKHKQIGGDLESYQVDEPSNRISAILKFIVMQNKKTEDDAYVEHNRP
jgi:hypothetical protein